jgi:hypothetical protein
MLKMFWLAQASPLMYDELQIQGGFKFNECNDLQ